MLLKKQANLPYIIHLGEEVGIIVEKHLENNRNGDKSVTASV